MRLSCGSYNAIKIVYTIAKIPGVSKLIVGKMLLSNIRVSNK